MIYRKYKANGNGREGNLSAGESKHNKGWHAAEW
jgi:hypothetical protein